MNAYTLADLPATMQNKIRIDGDCWIWTGAVNNQGYGSAAAGGHNRSMLAHRKAYEATRGPIPAGLTIDHLCRQKLCQNVNHMEIVTRAENSRRANAEQTHCKKGHPLTGDNLYEQRRGDRIHRVCRTCQREFYRQYVARKQALAA